MDAITLDVLESRVASGDREAFADLYDLVAPRIYGDLLRAFGDDRAQTLVTRLLVDAWKHAARLRRQRASICAWVLDEARLLVAATSDAPPRIGTTTTALDDVPPTLPGAVAAA